MVKNGVQSNMSDHLPSEIVEEILHRLPLKSIVKFTTVCKAWNSLIKDKTFIHDHLNRTIDQASNGNNDAIFFHFSILKDVGRFYLQRQDFYSLYSVDQQANHLSLKRFPLSHLFQRDRYRERYTPFAGTCNGLICYADYSPSDSATILIWNPLLRKYVVLPKPIMTCNKRDRQHYPRYDVCFGFGFDSRNNDYKVVRFLNLRCEEGTPHVEVYSLVSRSWKRITVGVPPFKLRYLNFDLLPPVFVNGAIHWVANRGRGDIYSEHKFILSFDVTEETFRELTLPQESNHKKCYISKLLVVEGGLSLAVLNYHTETRKFGPQMCNIWVMKEYGINESWTKIFHIDRSLYGGISLILAFTSTGKVVGLLMNGAIVLIDPVKETVGWLGSGHSQTLVGPYVESLFFLNNNYPDVLSF